ncbi:unnamed protein product [Amoebophrya sp. A25]|nr:unnamed protein product [Amoebophrya sp. A25]|eukprot:GSA25T00001057001.1
MAASTIGQGKNGSFITGLELDEVQYRTTSSSSAFQSALAALDETKAAYRVDDARLPFSEQCLEVSLEQTPQGATTQPVFPLPVNLPLEKIKKNCAINLDIGQSMEQQIIRAQWARSFASPAASAIIADMFWYAICYYFKSGEFLEEEEILFDRLSMNYVALFANITPGKRDFFFQHFADAVAQAVLYCMFLAFPKSRVSFGANFRKDLVCRISYWFTGFSPQFLSISHWKLNLGGGDVLKTAEVPGEAAAAAGGLLELTNVGADAGHDEQQSSAPIKSRPPRVMRTLRHSPLLEHFVKEQKFGSANLVKALKIMLTDAEDHVQALHRKHSKLPKQAAAAKKVSEDLLVEYEKMNQELKREEVQKTMQLKNAMQAVETKKKELLRKAPHDFANYLVSLKLLQSE